MYTFSSDAYWRTQKKLNVRLERFFIKRKWLFRVAKFPDTTDCGVVNPNADTKHTQAGRAAKNRF